MTFPTFCQFTRARDVHPTLLTKKFSFFSENPPSLALLLQTSNLVLWLYWLVSHFALLRNALHFALILCIRKVYKFCTTLWMRKVTTICICTCVKKLVLFVSLHFALERYQILLYIVRKVTTICIKINFSNKNNSNTSLQIAGGHQTFFYEFFSLILSNCCTALQLFSTLQLQR